MLEIHVKDVRTLKFEMEIGGISPNQLEGMLRFMIDNVEYGSPASISATEINVEIPPLKRLVQREMQEGEKFSARLDVYGDQHYLKPWSGEFVVKNPVIVEAKIKESEDVITDKPEIRLTVTESGETKAKKKLSEMKRATRAPQPKVKSGKFKNIDDFKKNLTREDVFKWLTKNGTKNPEIQELVYEQTPGGRR